jgi:hypothetical protein
MYIFDALVYNPGRGSTSILYNLENWQLILSNNGKTFAAKRLSPKYLEEVPLNINSFWKQALTRLDDETLETNLGNVLDKRRIASLAKRRDQLLELTN